MSRSLLLVLRRALFVRGPAGSAGLGNSHRLLRPRQHAENASYKAYINSALISTLIPTLSRTFNVRINAWRIQTSEFSTELMWWRIQANLNPPRINSDINVGINVCCSLQLYYDKTPPTLIPTLIPGLMCGGFRFV